MRTRPAHPTGPARISRDRWLIAYADMVTLLFACFVALFAARLGLVPPVAASGSASRQATHTAAAVATDAGWPAAPGDDLHRALERLVRNNREATTLDLSADVRGYVLSLSEAGSFPNGRADLTPAASRVMLDLADVLRASPNAIRVEGHTDDVAIHTAGFRSNWELSVARATEVVQLLIDQGRLSPGRLSAAGYGEFRPKLPNTSAAARARNRRVDIVVLTPATAAAEEPRAAGAQP